MRRRGQWGGAPLLVFSLIALVVIGVVVLFAMKRSAPAPVQTDRVEAQLAQATVTEPGSLAASPEPPQRSPQVVTDSASSPPPTPAPVEQTELEKFEAMMGPGMRDRLKAQGESVEIGYRYSQAANAVTDYGATSVAYQLARMGSQQGCMPSGEILAHVLTQRSASSGALTQQARDAALTALGDFRTEFLALYQEQWKAFDLKLPGTRKFADMIPYFDREMQFWKYLDSRIPAMDVNSKLLATLGPTVGNGPYLCPAAFPAKGFNALAPTKSR